MKMRTLGKKRPWSAVFSKGLLVLIALGFGALDSWAAINWSATYGRRGFSSAAQVRPTSAAGVASGNLYVVQIVVESGNCATLGTPAGWARHACDGHANHIQAIYTRPAQPADLNVTFNFPLGATRSWASILTSYAGVDLANPIDAGPVVTTYTNSKNATSAALTTQTNGAMGVLMTSANTSDKNFFSPPNNWKERSERACDNKACRITMSDSIHATAGTQAAVTTTTEKNASGLVHRLALRPYSLVAYWPLDGIPWTADLSGNNHHLTANGGAQPQSAKVCTGFAGTGSEYLSASDANALDLPDRYTLMAWVYPTAHPPSDLYTILSKDENYELHLNSQGKLYWWWSRVSASAVSVVSNAMIPLNQWTHVAVVFERTATSQRQRLYINGVLDNTANYSEQAQTNADPLLIGADINYTTRHFRGKIDEVRIYNGALSAAEIAAAMALTHPCLVDHYRLKINDGQALTCESESVSIEACADANCATPYSGNAAVTLDATNGAKIDGQNPPVTVSISNGGGSALISKTAAGSTVLSMSAGNPAPTANPGYRCYVAGSEVAWSACQISFQDAVLRIDVPDFTACTGTANATITAEGCGATISGNQNLKVWMNYVDPSSANGESLRLGTLVVPTSKPSSNNLTNLNFTDGEATLPLVNYDDAGELRLNAELVATGGTTLTGSGTFVVAPEKLQLSSAAGACAAPYPSCNKFKKAGESFDLSLKALCSSGKVTKNFRGDNIALKHSRLAPDPGADGSFAPPTVSLVATDNGSKTFQAAISEVGVFSVAPDLFQYKGVDVPGEGTGPLGRFYPAYFDTVVEPACGSFTYSGQPFGLSVTAKNSSGVTTQNYAGSFAKTVTLIDGNGASGSFSPPTLSATSFSDGVADLMDPPSVSFAFASKLTGPAILKLRTRDTDMASDTVGMNEGEMPLRSGRLLLSNAHGSELLDLTMPIQTQYWTGSAWATNSLDSCTDVSSSLVFVKTPPSLPSPTGGTITNGQGQLSFPAPNQKGSIEVCANIGDDSDNPLTGCRDGTSLPWLQGSWDVDNYSKDDPRHYKDNPSARATFGIFKGRAPVIYRRERY